MIKIRNKRLTTVPLTLMDDYERKEYIANQLIDYRLKLKCDAEECAMLAKAMEMAVEWAGRNDARLQEKIKQEKRETELLQKREEALQRSVDLLDVRKFKSRTDAILNIVGEDNI